MQLYVVTSTMRKHRLLGEGGQRELTEAWGLREASPMKRHLILRPEGGVSTSRKQGEGCAARQREEHCADSEEHVEL